ncbi:unnamed protein product [Sphagnum jensenii]|uniref:Uncharacterized protein n=1 Tax=Sphagnum jensenii TaxID=128206 RepID=A0ABP1B350_9BRYO
MSRNVNGTTGMQRVDAVLQDIMQSIDPNVVDWNDGSNLALRISILEKIDYDAFQLLPFGTSPVCCHGNLIGSDLIDHLLTHLQNDLL